MNWEKILNMPVLASKHGKDVDELIIYLHWLMAVLFVGWLAYFIYVLLRFNSRSNPKADPKGVTGNMTSYVEVAVAVIEGILLVGFAIPLWTKVVDQAPPDNEAVVWRVVAQQFSWNFMHAGKDGKFAPQKMSLVAADNLFGIIKSAPEAKDDVVTMNDLHVPVNKKVILQISSKDVIHSFKVIAFRLTQDAIPGMRIPIWFEPTQEGKYQINCAQLCGNSHAFMRGHFYVKSKADYAAWIAEKSKSGGAAAGGFE